MVVPPIKYSTELASTKKLDQSIAVEESNNILEARIDSSKNQGNTDGFPISDVVVPFDTAIYTTAAAAKSTVEPETLPHAVADTIYTIPTRREPGRLIGEGDLFEDGYDSDGKIGPFSDAILLEGEQDFDEDQLGTEADGYGDIDGYDDGDSSGDSKEEEEEFDHTENLNAIKAMELKKVKLELYLRLEISLGKKVGLVRPRGHRQPGLRFHGRRHPAPSRGRPADPRPKFRAWRAP